MNSKIDDMHRCGGRPFLYQGYNVWITQDCKESYGNGLIFRFMDSTHRSEVFTRELKAEDIKFDRHLDQINGIHTYCGNSNMEVIDIKTIRFNILNFFMRIVNKFSFTKS